MKIQCDVCNKDEASVFCTADEAALCDTCDHRVHHANKLASKHQRFSLIHPSSKQFPLCDICQERRAFLFCQQDRAILCRECDAPIHTANEHTQKHNRFLLTGVKLSAVSALYTSSALESGSDSASVPESKSEPSRNSFSVSPEISKDSFSVPKNPTLSSKAATIATKNVGNLLTNEEGGCGSTSSISEYLIETLPGWHVEDFLDSSSTPLGFCKSDDGILPFSDGDFESNLGSFSSENMGIWVPQASSLLYPPEMVGPTIGFKETKEATYLKANNRTWRDDGFTVPQISSPSIGSKRSRPYW
ncbi:B-box zinc finger protein 21 [Ziziphus jujuba]|uniref:B-box zinc finger protein 21 n=2 Tax=Ziziphus jujuba TaxID=326968 RepID=A0A6P3ZWP9_ZIZJJ|nr:B-box zinc finger protein 21 [Ziziphus jujuba]KAH7523552.1 hypothetical protein FEM48_Zijuj06G0024200 [Ziziphus jujuba var. spinosa]